MKRNAVIYRNWITFVGLLQLAVAAPAPGAEEVFTSQHITRVRSVTSAEISPDGRHVAYVLSVPRKPMVDDDGAPWAELHVVDAKGTSRSFVSGEINVGGIQWTPDGTALTFVAKRGKDEDKCLYRIPLDGGEARNILKFDSDIGDYSWSPDGKRVAFIASEKKEKDRKKREDKGFKQKVYEEDYRQSRVWIARPDDPESKPKALELPGFPSELHWSPAAEQIAVALAPTPLIDDHYMKRKLFVYDVDSASLVSSFPNPGKLGRVSWSPDGRHLAVLSAEDIHDPSQGRLMLASVADGSFRDLVPDYEGAFTSARWQDADTIMFLCDQGVWTTFGERRHIAASGSDREKPRPTEFALHIQPGKGAYSNLSLSRDGQCGAMLSDSATHPAEVFFMCHGDEGLRRLTFSNPWLDDMRFAQQEPVTYKARDGLTLEGLLIRPLNEQPGTRYPLILCVHGGPEAHDRNGWLTNYADPGQVAAANGFAVFYPNYRGSTGRGVAFSKLGQADHGGREFDDLVDAVEHLVQIGLVDRAKVGITGGSYGGYASAWAATYLTKHFAASVMFVGVSDLVSKYGTTDIPNEMHLVHGRKYLWEAWDFYRERSPITYVEQARTPLLIMHGEDDPRVHPSQSLELYRTLKMYGKTPVRLVLYPGEGHGNRKAAARLDYNLRMMQWFDHYLKGAGGEPPPYELDYGVKEEVAEEKKDEIKTE